ncbi:MAG: Sll0939 protein [uncultured Chloroflexi bacterium]|uniref:Sll0939 protein n=1 Tax=uncultured Chloroflexota bacterium TaxID=166587 RepID=A0A6J4J903_9CHLR|nr:MAG: Sll0939 protein [uncultured Chloroflexota bacterium]
MEHLSDPLRAVAQAVATVVEGIGVLVVAVAVGLALLRYTVALVKRDVPFPPDGLRLNFGRSLTLALEFLLAADILRTAVEPTWDEIARLAAIAAIRTALNFFLQHELAADTRQAARNVKGRDQMAGGAP